MGPRLYHPHSIFGIVTIVLIVATLAPGISITRGHNIGTSFRQIYRYIGRISLALVAINIALGLSRLPVITAQE